MSLFSTPDKKQGSFSSPGGGSLTSSATVVKSDGTTVGIGGSSISNNNSSSGNGGGGTGVINGINSSSSPSSGLTNSNVASPNDKSPQLLVRPSSKSESKLRSQAEKAVSKAREDSEIRRAQEKVRRDMESDLRNKTWKEEILPIWLDSLDPTSSTCRESLLTITTEAMDDKIRDLCWQGIPSNMRRYAWPLLIGNDLKITPELFNSLRLQLELVQIRQTSMSSDNGGREEEGGGGVGGISLYSDHNSPSESLLNALNNNISSNHNDDNSASIKGGISSSSSISNNSNSNSNRSSSNDNNDIIKSSNNSNNINASSSSSKNEIAESIPSFASREGGDNEGARNNPNPSLSSPSSPSSPSDAALRDDSADSNSSSELNTRSRNNNNTSSNNTRAALAPLLNMNFKQHETIALIEFDLPRTFPQLQFFHDGGSLQLSLEKILQCYAHYKPEVGYVQGMSYLAAVLLLYMDEYEAFTSLSNLICRRGNMDFFQLRKASIDSYVSLFDFFFEKHLPLLFSHMRAQGISTEMYLMDWHLSLFAKTMPLDLVARLWDTYLYDGEVFLVRTGLAILRTFAPRLCTLSLEDIMSFLTKFPEEIDPDELYYNINQIKISHSKYEQVRHKYNMSNNHFFHSSLNSLKTRINTGKGGSGGGGGGAGGGGQGSLTSSYGEKRINRRSYRDDCSLS